MLGHYPKLGSQTSSKSPKSEQISPFMRLHAPPQILAWCCRGFPEPFLDNDEIYTRWDLWLQKEVKKRKLDRL